MRVTARTWAVRVAAWKASGKSEREFAAEKGYAFTTFRWWSWRLRTKKSTKATESSSTIQMARVVRVPQKREADATLVVELGGSVRVVVRRGFDGDLLREVVSAVGGAR